MINMKFELENMSNLRGHFFMENAEEMLLPWKNNPNFVPIVLTHVITFVIGLVGNIVVISTMSRGHGERSVTRSDDHLYYYFPFTYIVQYL